MEREANKPILSAVTRPALSPVIKQKLAVVLMLAPALAVILLLFGSGLGLALAQSLGYLPAIGRTDLTLEAYRQVLGDPAFGRSLLLTTWIAGASTALSTVLALVAALALRRVFRGKRVATFIFQSSLPIPHLVGAIGILFLFSQSGFVARLAHLAGLIRIPADFPALVFDRYAMGIILEYVWKSSVFIGIIFLAALQSIGEDYEEVARTLGAGRWQRVRHVVLPLLRPNILSASVLVFAFTFGAFEVPLLLGSRYPSALPVMTYRLYTDVDLNARPEAMALSVIIAVIVTILIAIYARLTRKLA
ncbi:MAG: sugar ABC transporter permease [Anaerolineales bacterium]|uniref:ABC transporter permease n=1 Tax=Promineifilum sp. TaxID=2664178 RepID=UPI001D5A7201|nr:sugar ABC transporter permease [Anaerolineales bacterium]MCO5180379.1 sugar ABC transporter permease [Promineifilum sp.]